MSGLAGGAAGVSREIRATLDTHAAEVMAPLSEPARVLAMLGLQSERYSEDPEYRDAVDAVLALTISADRAVPVEETDVEAKRGIIATHTGTGKKAILPCGVADWPFEQGTVVLVILEASGGDLQAALEDLIDTVTSEVRETASGFMPTKSGPIGKAADRIRALFGLKASGKVLVDREDLSEALKELAGYMWDATPAINRLRAALGAKPETGGEEDGIRFPPHERKTGVGVVVSRSERPPLVIDSEPETGGGA